MRSPELERPKPRRARRRRVLLVVVACAVVVSGGLWLCRTQVTLAYYRWKLRSGDEYVVCAAIREIAKHRDARAVDDLIRLLGVRGHSRARVNCKAAWALAEIGDPRAVEPLCAAVERQDPSGDVTSFLRAAIDALGKLGGSRAESCIAAYAEHPDSYVRSSVLAAMAALGTDSAKDVLVRMLKDPEPDIRHDAGVLLARLGDTRALPALLEMARTDHSLRTRLRECLPFLPAEAVWSAALPVIADASADVQLRGYLLFALAGHKGRSAFPVLVQYLTDSSPAVRGFAASALRQSCALDPAVKDRRAVPHFIKALEDTFSGVRGLAAAALGELGDPQAAPALITHLSDADDGVVLSAAEALGALGSHQAVPALCKLLDHQNDYVRRRSVEALEKITGARLGAASHPDTPAKWKEWWKRERERSSSPKSGDQRDR